MITQIEGGTGSGYRAKVDTENRLSTFSITETRLADISARTGDAFILTSDFVSLTTTGSFSGIMYIKNTSTTENIFVDRIRICGTGSSMGSLQTKLVKNPTAGTLISDENAGISIPANLGSQEVFSGLNYAASADGKTVTDGTQFSQFTIHLPGHTIQDYQGNLIIPGGASMGIALKPSYSTEACIEIQCWFEDKK